jgi:hypothetical protein
MFNLALMEQENDYFLRCFCLATRFLFSFCRLDSSPTFSGSTRMSALMASSKLNGWSETGFAFGIEGPPLANAFAHSLADISSEHASAAACSASHYERREHIPVVSVVMPERKLCQVQRQIGLADIVVGADDATKSCPDLPYERSRARIHLAHDSLSHAGASP